MPLKLQALPFFTSVLLYHLLYTISSQIKMLGFIKKNIFVSSSPYPQLILLLTPSSPHFILKFEFQLFCFHSCFCFRLSFYCVLLVADTIFDILLDWYPNRIVLILIMFVPLFFRRLILVYSADEVDYNRCSTEFYKLGRWI